jgi:predicted ArsR family transcriptional regulator
MQLNIFDAPYQAHSQTSAQAAARIAPSAGSLRALVLAAIKALGPMTDEEIAELCHLNPSTARPRRLELQRAGLVVADGTKPTRSGRQATIWRAT